MLPHNELPQCAAQLEQLSLAQPLPRLDVHSKKMLVQWQPVHSLHPHRDYGQSLNDCCSCVVVLPLSTPVEFKV